MKAIGKYEERARAITSLLCIGLDAQFGQIPPQFQTNDAPQFAFNKWIIDQTYIYASAYKMNIGYYLARGHHGLHELKLTVDYLQENHPDIMTICDAKFADSPANSAAYAASVFDWFDFDAVTLNPYLGKAALGPFLEREDRACIIVCHTTPNDDEELQNRQLRKLRKSVWGFIAEQVSDEWNSNDNCMLLIDATEPETLREARNIVGEMTLFIPGVDAHRADIEQIVRGGLNNDGLGLIINATPEIIFAESPSEAARELRDDINLYD